MASVEPAQKSKTMPDGLFPKYAFITGGVVSSLGKGLSAANPQPGEDFVYSAR